MPFYSPLLVFLPLIALFSATAEARPHRFMQALQNELADHYHLPRFRDIGQLRASINSGKLVKVEETDAYSFDPTFGERDPEHRQLYAHVQPWTKAFLDRELGAAHAKFGTRYVITSMVRTQQYQDMLCGKRSGRRNANAICGARGWQRSAHLTGATVDIGRLGLSDTEQDWIRHRLNMLLLRGKLVYIAEAGQQYCFHIMVLPSYDRAAKTDSNDRRQKTRR